MDKYVTRSSEAEWAPPIEDGVKTDGIHFVHSRSGCALLFVVPEEVQIIDRMGR